MPRYLLRHPGACLLVAAFAVTDVLYVHFVRDYARNLAVYGVAGRAR